MITIDTLSFAQCLYSAAILIRYSMIEEIKSGTVYKYVVSITTRMGCWLCLKPAKGNNILLLLLLRHPMR